MRRCVLANSFLSNLFSATRAISEFYANRGGLKIDFVD
ncbi:hypothetical protein T05_433 [Trichinella murrelli]|uniref:Uncharacterized protein n=1 Tax=Trichinella murrelli TaxID=144512 RepID=A0A0V0SW07_9BILA|nr:hypothetical protein T05_433 [Trichinella murrelli]